MNNPAIGEVAERRGDDARAGQIRNLTSNEIDLYIAKTLVPAAKDSGSSKVDKPRLLSGGNPQIPKGDGAAPVRAYISAMPGWKSDVGHNLDELIVRTVPDVRKAVRWNSPFYSVEGQDWFLSYHCFTNYIKVTFFQGSSLKPVPPVEGKDKNARYFHIHEDDQFDEELVMSWITQAAALPGWVP